MGELGRLEPQVILMGEKLEGKRCLTGGLWRDREEQGWRRWGGYLREDVGMWGYKENGAGKGQHSEMG